MSLASLAERRSMVTDAGELFILSGGATFTGRFNAESIEVLEVRTNGPSVVAPYEDVKHVQVNDTIWRKAKNDRYEVADIIPDGREGLTVLVMSLDQ